MLARPLKKRSPKSYCSVLTKFFSGGLSNIEKPRFALTFLFVAIFSTAYGTWTPSVASANYADISISPLRSYPAQAPQESTKHYITLKNNSPDSQTIDIGVERFKTINESYDYSFSNDSDAIQWIKFASNQHTLKPSEIKTIPYYIDVPYEAKPGGYYLIVTASISTRSNTSSLTEVKRVGSLVFLQVNGAIEHQLNYLGQDVSRFSFSNTMNVSYRISNSGTSHEILSFDTKPMFWFFNIGQASIDEHLILPGTIRKVDQPIKLGLLPGVYKLNTVIGSRQGQVTNDSRIIVYTPYWSFALIALLVLAYLYIRIKKR